MTIEQKILISGIRRDMKIVEEVYKELLDKAYNEKTFHYSLMLQYPENSVLSVIYTQHDAFVAMLVRSKNRKLYDLTIKQADILEKNTLSLRQTVAKQFNVSLTKEDILEKGDEPSEENEDEGYCEDCGEFIEDEDELVMFDGVCSTCFHEKHY